MTQAIPNERVYTKLREAVEWLLHQTGSTGGSRFEVYLKIWRDIVTKSDLPNGGTSRGQVKRIHDQFGLNAYVGAVHEAMDLIHVYQMFGHSNEIPLEILKKILGGKFSEREETRDVPSTAQARNYLFELNVAALFKRRGFTVRLTGKADVFFNFNNHRAFIECKRIQSEKGLESNIRKASNQLHERFLSFGLPVNLIGQIPIGLSIYSVGKIINPEQGVLVADSKDAAAATLDDAIDTMWNRRKSFVQTQTHPNIITSGFYARTAAELPTGFGVIQRWKFFVHRADGPLLPIAVAVKRQLLGA